MTTSRDKAVYAVGWLAGFEAVLWTLVGERLADETVARYADEVEALRKFVACGHDGTNDS